MTNYRKGFTFIELLVIIAVLAILCSLSISVFRSFRSRHELVNSSEEILSTLRLAQSKTVTSESASEYGVYFNDAASPNQYVFFKGSSYLSRDSAFDEVHSLSPRVRFYSLNLGADKEVVFERISGETGDTGSLLLGLEDDITEMRTIYVENSGQFGLIAGAVPSDDSRIKDSRHSHFDLGWSIQNATELKFYFPNAAQTEIISTGSYFNVGKTSFDWEGSFTVGGGEQVFRIHTHSLDAFNTFLCIHRDRNNGNNTQEVIIYIVDGGIDKDIGHYLADAPDTLEKGSYANSFIRQ